MSAKDKYYQFPICLLANITRFKNEESFEHTLNLIEAWTYENAGRKFVEDKRKEAGGAFLEENAPNPCIHDFDPDSEDHLHIAWGVQTLGLDLDSYEDTAAQLEEARGFADKWEMEHGGHLFCRIRKDILAEMHQHSSLSPRDFSALCGLFAVIGRTLYKQVPLNRIYYAANGCKSKLVFQASGKHLEPALTLKQVRTAIEKLHDRSFFAAVTYQRRYKYFSPRLSQPKLRSTVLDHFKKLDRDKATKKKQSIISISKVTGTRRHKQDHSHYNNTENADEMGKNLEPSVVEEDDVPF